MKKILLVLFICFFTSYIYAQYKVIDSLLSSIADFSAVVFVAENGNPVYQKAVGFRDFDKNIPLQTTDIFELASISKQFTSMIIMMLKEKGKLSYSDPLEKYIDLPYKGVTIRHLLTHTSGLPDYMDVMDTYWDKNKVAGNDDCIAYLKKYSPPVLFQPGEKYTYSNTGYMLLASIAEKAGGKDFTWMSRKWIFKKLKMKNTAIRTPAEKSSLKNYAMGHILVKERNQPALPAGRYIRADSFPSSDYTIWLGNRKGPGRISSTTTDLLKWDNTLYTEKLIKQSTLLEAYTPMKLNDQSVSNYGFGWSIRQDSVLGKIVEHTGGNPGISNIIIRYLDQKKTIIVLCNNAHIGMKDLVNKIETLLIK